jgi:hypothetical protein
MPTTIAREPVDAFRLLRFQGRWGKIAAVQKFWWLTILLLGIVSPAMDGQAPDFQLSPMDGIPVLPSKTDAQIQTFDFPHYIFLNPDIIITKRPNLLADRHQLLLFIPGTQPPGSPHKGKGPYKFFEEAANLGYHVIFLTYPNDVSAAEACNRDPDPRAFEKFRMALITGGSFKNAFKDITIAPADSIENRLTKLLVYLKTTRPQEDWGQFLNGDGSIKWGVIAIAGQSQGGGHAALIAIKHRVARVICSGAPKDFNHVHNRPAAWYHEESATPKNRFFAFNHDQDRTGNCTPEEQMENLRALGLQRFGTPADVDVEKPPYHHTRILKTNYPGGKLESVEAHTTFLNPKNAEVFKIVWDYVLTDPCVED